MVAVWIGAQALDNADTDDHDTEGAQALAEAVLALGTPDWYADALCREYDAALWFPERGQSTQPAKDVCARCLVAAECDAYADAQDDLLVGIWAGESHRARKKRHQDERRRAARELGIVA